MRLATCCDCGQPLGNAESMVRNNGQLSHLDACPTRSDLCETADEAQQHVAAGRSWPSLKEGKQFDSERLSESPLFKTGGLL
jgi:hypothetical protein